MIEIFIDTGEFSFSILFRNSLDLGMTLRDLDKARKQGKIRKGFWFISWMTP